MNYGDFKAVVEDFIGKKGMTGKVPIFIRLAKLNIQRQHDFAFTRHSQDLSYPSTTNTGVTLPVDFKNFYGEHAVSQVVSGAELPLEASDEFKERARSARSTSVVIDDNSQITQINSNVVLPVRYYIKRGSVSQTLFLLPEQLSATLRVVYYAWLPDYVLDTEEDELLKFGFDFLLWESLVVANNYLFEEDRVTINEVAKAKAFDDFCSWDDRFARSNAPIDLS